MKKFRISTFSVFLVYLGVLLGYFVYAGFTGTRILGDDKEEYKPEGPPQSGQTGVYRSYNRPYYRSYHRSYHK